ncbi:hypothetical protein JHK82_012751 [Glycine max]|uniref:Uncharacterized protein n=1 Tax=Glycine soja TaxID=3848 RepID=A0A445KMK7_GLYSO|nr:uncharacterized protein LOC114412615 [Glycine soja]XP_028232375.1 uncharacterized protein LOC114412615 [Glycine soja]XP_028232376.1 uncharacterized protein LOC114412615 [Glycine soja]XP_028232377.1 uncharacterized protein LOC114412615 [Glycine soja]XP_028232378.1 uncharacterized protein LOC114412615 [Glycine soja]KAG5154782.1 hypothetical protein JHK82_012751 [Glycine max]RZC12146.1 hypothetical protein D0Y65_012094 [Glycine soja]RZC12147.1 hypothetical protein D0Y65_012094 [Glycine soja]
MAKGSRGRHRIASRQFRVTPYPLASCKRDICEDLCQNKCSKALEKKEWEDVTCSVCMEYPHNAVLLLCSSHDKGCRPYMCGTSFRHSNCLDQYKKAYTKAISPNRQPMQGTPGLLQDSNMHLEKSESTELACPLCRGQVKGWTVVEPVRDYLNAKKRGCMQDDCSFVGNYKELKKHVRAEHPSARPRMVDPADEQKWRWLEWEREREDVISTVTSAMPGAVVFGDYVIEGHHNDFDTDEEEGAGNAGRNGRFQMGLEAMNFFLLLHAVRQGNELNNLGRRLRPELTHNRVAGQNAAAVLDISDEDNDNDGRYNEDNNSRYNEDTDGGVSLVSRLHRHGGGRVLLGRSGRRRRCREARARIGDS